MGKALPTDRDLMDAASDLQKRGARNVLISLGGDGALLLDENGAYHRADALPIIPVNTVGAGDSTVAGFLAGVSRGYGYALKLAMACGGATAASEGLATGDRIQALLHA
jgi:1-phosphofructokinase